MADHTPGYAAALAAAEHHATIKAQHDAEYIAELAVSLEQATEFRIPCPGHPHGHHADLRVIRRTDGHGDGWAITRDGGHFSTVWTGTVWQGRHGLSRNEIYHYNQHTALAEAARIAPLETAAFRAYIAALHAETADRQ